MLLLLLLLLLLFLYDLNEQDDFYPKDTAAQTVHIVSNAYNSVMMGEIATADWDMFQSKHPYAEMHAAARAISGDQSID